MLSIILMDRHEDFIQFLDPDLCSIVETAEYGGVRSAKFNYKFQNFKEDKELFIHGNKIWIQGDENLFDCLYVINTEVIEDVYGENEISFEMEEVLVELNYAPLFSQTELSKENFTTRVQNGEQQVKIDWNSLNYWFGDFFNVGVVQDCLSEYASYITFSGTMTLMSLLRHIEEQTGNVFVTRYEKSVFNNIIHRYLDFLNPINIDRDWILNLEYTFQGDENISICFDENDNETTEDIPYLVTPFDDGEPPESVAEDDEYEWQKGTEMAYDWIREDEEIDLAYSTEYIPLVDINPSRTVFRITNEDGELYDVNAEIVTSDEWEADTLEWDASTVGLNENDESVIISIVKKSGTIGVDINQTSFAISSDVGVREKGYLDISFEDIDPVNKFETVIPDDSYFTMYDPISKKILFKTKINHQIGSIHEEILDLGFNVENIQFTRDETSTYSAVSPIIEANDLSRTQIGKLVEDWANLSVKKGDIIPMIVERVNIKAPTLANAKTTMGNYALSNNYYSRPYNPNDNKDGSTPSDYTWEFWRASSYWKAPFTKNKGDLHISSENVSQAKYFEIMHRPDTRDDRGAMHTPKMGITETSDENIFQIYNQVALYLKEHQSPAVDIEVDVANLSKGEFNQYDIHDQVFVKMPDTDEIVTARVTKTTKESHDVAKNTLQLSNYTSKNTYKTLTKETYIDADNVNFKYPNTKTVSVKLVNADHDANDRYSTQYPSNKLLSFSLYKMDGGSASFTGKVYNKKTLAGGVAKIVLKLDPGDYELKIDFGGDEEYSSSNITIEVNVGGTKEVIAQMTKKDTTKAKTTSKTSTSKTKTVTKKTYYNKCGVSPDKKKIVAIAKPSGPDANKYSYRLYKTVFKNYCPICKKSGYLRFDGGKANKCITSAGARGRGYKSNIPEHEITCVACDSDYCGVTGAEKWNPIRGRLKTLEKPKKSSNTEFGKLTKGKLVYGTKKVKVSSKNNSNSKTRVTKGKISSKVKKQALAIVGNKTGLNAIKSISSWMDKHIAYADYPGHRRSASTVLSKGSGNCCDGTRLFFELCDGAGLTQFFKLQYVHTPGHIYAKVTTKKTGKWRWVDHASDYHQAWGYICRNYRSSNRSYKTYPNRFDV